MVRELSGSQAPSDKGQDLKTLSGPQGLDWTKAMIGSDSFSTAKMADSSSLAPISIGTMHELRAIAQMASDKLRSYLAKDGTSIECDNPFDQLLVQAQKPKDGIGNEAQDINVASDPKQKTKAQIDKLKEEIVKADRSPEKKRSWQQGLNMHDLAALEMSLGHYGEAVKWLKPSVDILTSELAKQNKPEEAGKVVTQTLIDYGIALVRPKEGLPQTKSQITKELKEADRVFDRAIQFAEKYKHSPLEQANIIREKGVNQIGLAAWNDVEIPEGKIAYRKEMQNAIDTFNRGLKLLEQQNSNDYKPIKATITGSLAFAEMSRADKAGDQDALNAEKHYPASIKLWHEYNAKKDAKNATEAKLKADVKDKSLLVDLSGYLKLLNALGQGQGPTATALEGELTEILARHPEMKIK